MLKSKIINLRHSARIKEIPCSAGGTGVEAAPRCQPMGRGTHVSCGGEYTSNGGGVEYQTIRSQDQYVRYLSVLYQYFLILEQ